MSSGIFVLFVAAAAAAFFYSRRCSRLPLPPGPRPKFFSGNVHQLPKKEPVWTYATWAERYRCTLSRPIFSFRVPNRQFIVLSSLKSATDLLDSRATTYSDRPKLWMAELAKQNLNVFNISFTHPYFKTYRTVLKNSLSTRTIQTYQSLQTEQCRVLVDSLHKDPEHFAGHITRNAAAVILYLAYGWKVVEMRFLPSWFPGAGFKRVAFDIGKKLSRFDGTPFNWTKQQIQSGNYTHSFVSEQLFPGDGSTVSAQQEDIIAWCSQGIYGAGVDTTASSLTSFILAMMLYPEVQKRAQAEIDAIVGRDQFPAFKDREKLPYIGALIQELLRWAPVVSEGVPHCSMREDVYEGYRIPKGSIVISNILSISRDKEMYPDPLEFKPERFIGPSPQTDPRKFVFGFGGRRCPGLHFAEALLYLNISCILAAFTIVKQLDEMGEEITPPVEFENVGPLWHPKPFKCRFIPRNKDLLATVSQ
ncbi:cytochrome P450 [Suillus occidentalis]|nr:cytochrome P450 [Suillus occidentalis]